ncbi:efflux transporter periplasmic adaptor subunit [Methyloceanibacter methanicus]|uniref:Efflux transporter periplasmic adaptor subunit n=1 Tax=Methyloceanibacter methanicus TaxID=1774968 RepID=A0A1E3W128_9HYPH|nr:efflux transporter periplasmic adaptor subunit [Methyloceanibacter methanicus]
MGLALLVAGCDATPEEDEAPARPVRTVTLEKSDKGVPVVMTGRVEALDQVSLGFRLSGQILSRPVSVGDAVKPGQILAELNSDNEANALRSAKASLNAALAEQTQVQNHFERQETLLAQGWTTRANFDQAERELRTAEAQVEAAEAQLAKAHDQVGFTQLTADAEGVVTAVGADAGEVVQAGQMIVTLAREDGRDAVFDVPAQVLRSPPADPVIAVHLADAPSVTAMGRVRQVSPQADPVTRTFRVKVGLSDVPEAMRLGATVTGTMASDAEPMIEIPSSALTESEGKPAVWIVDPDTSVVRLRNISVLRFNPTTVTVDQGLDVGDVLVTAGVQALRPDQKVRILGSGS